MKKIIMFTILSVLLSCGGNEKPKRKKVEGQTTNIAKEDEETEDSVGLIRELDLERLNSAIDLNMNISGLSLSDLRILRNVFAARQGYCFMKADLRGIFSTTSWYDDKMEERYWAEEGERVVDPISYTDEEQRFIEKIKAREVELKKQNFRQIENRKSPNMSNVVNLFQMEETPQKLKTMLGQYGFAIIPNDNIQLFHVYEKNDYQQFPNFVTTDMYMQLFHMYFGYVLRTVEEDHFISLLSQICEAMMTDMITIQETATETSVKEIAQYNYTYYAIAYSILSEKKVEVPEQYALLYDKELQSITAGIDGFSEFLDIGFFYSLFKPRGHYTRTDGLKRYFKAMMWLQTASFCLDNDVQLRRAIMSASTIANSPNFEEKTLIKYMALMEPINFIIGLPDNVSFLNLIEVIQKNNLNLNDLLVDQDALQGFRKDVEKIASDQNRINSGQGCEKINCIPQRYLSDNEVLQALVDVESKVTKRAYPKGLDVMAAFGSSSANEILINELNEGEKWDKYPQILAGLQNKMKEVDWSATVYNKWVQSLLELQKPDVKYPYFMQTPQWAKKDLNASLASWAELKHDAILYAEQPMAAECGDGGPPSPYTIGYVEPNIKYWNSVIALTNLTKEVLVKHNLMNSKITRVTNGMIENAEFLLTASKKELEGKVLSEKEYRQIEVIGSTFEWLTLDLVTLEGKSTDSWENVTGPDKSVAVIADVYTSNGENNPDKGVLHVATGNVNDIYVIVEIEGYLYITKGAVFGYHEFHVPLGNRLTDEEWQKMLEDGQAPEVPSWIKEIILPINAPKSNEKIFYSSGC
ncbi:DUF3160 domain-containing protein [Aquimarina sp. I32.4]|uniref:DUF3160 domain-containing protein n=1 Tax=Aquimarina sp. I32.4 TaxID=2053903 RepID=UPI000CDE9488|nr:DUF3160 domain-containing protein [Aquimarina sp. I32.4]